MQDIGAVPIGEGRTRFTVRAPKRNTVEVAIDGQHHPLERKPDGTFSGVLRAPAGTRYRYRLDGADTFPDPVSRFQPEGPHGPSQVVDPSSFRWSDSTWAGVGPRGHVIYELHLGAFTKEGTYAAAAEQLPRLKELGVTLLEVMPLHGFPGAFNWGYDGVNLFAPAAVYGQPDDFRRFVDRAHALGLGVILDVVYNHLGPDGNYLHPYAEYFTHRYPDEWGTPLDFDGPGAKVARELVVANACAWVSEYHLDGLRLDATQNLYDASSRHIVAELAEKVRAAAAGRGLFLAGESERQDAGLLDLGLDAIWVDDFHHCNRVAATGAAEAYMQDYDGSARELLACCLRNGLYQGQFYAWQKKGRGVPLRHVEPHRIIFSMQNHDQIANSLGGWRLHHLAGEGLTRALTTFFLLCPQTPLLFMGQEHFAPERFFYFVDHGEPLKGQVAAGRREFLSQFPSYARALKTDGMPLPSGREAFEASKLDAGTRDQKAFTFHKELLALRKRLAGRPDGAVLGEWSLCLRWEQHLLVLELGPDRALTPVSEPLLAPPPGQRWSLAFSSEAARYGGRGAFASDGTGAWRVQGRCATVLEAA